MSKSAIAISSGCPSNRTVFAHSTDAPVAPALRMPSTVSGNTQSSALAGSGKDVGVTTFTPAVRNAKAMSAPPSEYPPGFASFRNPSINGGGSA